jgi:hypothetical protein
MFFPALSFLETVKRHGVSLAIIITCKCRVRTPYPVTRSLAHQLRPHLRLRPRSPLSVRRRYSPWLGESSNRCDAGLAMHLTKRLLHLYFQRGHVVGCNHVMRLEKSREQSDGTIQEK